MARYDYRCTACGEVFEVEHAMTERPEVSCPKCGAKAGIKFAGSGFYNTDQRGGSSSTEATSGSSDSSASTDSSASAGSSHSCENCPHKDA